VSIVTFLVVGVTAVVSGARTDRRSSSRQRLDARDDGVAAWSRAFASCSSS
jgi:hypothetical protein